MANRPPDLGELALMNALEAIDGQERLGDDAYELHDPQTLSCCAVFSSPHSGRAYSKAFLSRSRLDPIRLRASEDAFIDLLFRPATEFGAPLLAAVAPRAFVDLNRAAGDLDPALVEGAEARCANARVIAGLGVIPRIVAEGVSIYSGRIPLAEAEQRIRDWHAPYHRRLIKLLLRARRAYGRALLIDCHSMPSGMSNGVRPSRRRGPAADIVLGDRFGMASDPELMDQVEAAFEDAGFRVARNTPFAGGYITERYGRPALGVSAIQIEIDRALYLDQAQVEPNDGYEATARALRGVVARICEICRDAGAPSLDAEIGPLAAE